MTEERCENCAYYHRLKHNFKIGVGLEESHCCDALFYEPDSENDPAEPWVQEVLPTDGCELFSDTKRDKKTVTTKQLEEMYERYQKKLWREREDVRGDDMIELGYAEEFLQELLLEFGCWDDEEEKCE